MTPEEFDELERDFQRATGLEGPERERFVAAMEAESPDRGSQLRRLLAADADPDESTLREPIAATAEALSGDAADPWRGRRVGEWTLRRRLATGGMGAVFLADRAEREYTQQAALKLMSAQLLGSRAVERFRAERQILANLNHPYIAKLIDGGSTGEGLPYFAMEYVEGEPLDAYCDRHALDLPARLALFIKVCEAVDYAHRKLVVHRDLKPGNILVDANGAPRLLDFGIAKLLELAPGEPGAARTIGGARAMTPEYASPEQVRGEPVSVATDVYSLGVLLFRLLTGQSPYGPTPVPEVDLARAIVDTPARRPSVAVTASRSLSGMSAGLRGVIDVERLRRHLAGDLDNIVLKSLQKEPERRYLTVAALAADIRRYLADEPVEARGDAWTYRSRKFIARNTRWLAAVAAAFIVVASLVIFHTVRVATERDRAQVAAAEAREISSFLDELFRSASPFETAGNAVTVTDLLDRGRERIGQLDDQPAVQAGLAEIMGMSYAALDGLDKAQPLLEKAVELRQRDAAAHPLELATALRNRGEVRRLSGAFRAAEEDLSRAATIRERQLGRVSSPVADALDRLGVAMFDDGRANQAIKVLREALAIQRQLRKDDALTLDILNNLGISLDRIGRLEEAEKMMRGNVQLSVKLVGERSPITLIRMDNHALVLMRLDRYAEALPVFTRALALSRQVFPQPHSQTARLEVTTAHALRYLGRFAEARALYEEALDTARRATGEQSRPYLIAMRGFIRLEIDSARYAEAEQLTRKALPFAQAVDGGAGHDSLLLQTSLGEILVLRRHYAEAEVLLRQPMPTGGVINADSARTARQFLAVALSHEGHEAEASRLFRQIITEQAASTGADSAAMIFRLRVAAEHFLRIGQADEAVRLAGRAYELARQKLPPGNWRAALATLGYAEALAAAGRASLAAPLRSHAHEDLLTTFGADDPRVRRAGLAGPRPE